MDRLLILLGVKKPEIIVEQFPPLPQDDDINSKGMTQYFDLNLKKAGSTATKSISNSALSESGTSATRSVADSSDDQDPYRDVSLRVHVRLLKKQNNMKVRLHVKVDPEETDNWIIPDKGKANDLFFNNDEQYEFPRRISPIKEHNIEYEDLSDGYHSQTNSQSSIAEMSEIPALDLNPIINEDDKFRFLMEELNKEKQDYDTTKLEIIHFVYAKALKGAVSSEEVKKYPFDKICIILRDYFNVMGISIANSGDLVFFEKAKKRKPKKKKGMGSIDLLSQAHQKANYDLLQETQKQEFSTKKKYCKEAIELYTELEERFINYRAYYYEAVDCYDVQIIESRFGYFMCEMQEELMTGNMILSGQVVPD